MVVVLSASSVIVTSVVASWVSASCFIPSVVDAALVVVASVDYIFCLRFVVSGGVVPLVVPHLLAL